MTAAGAVGYGPAPCPASPARAPAALRPSPCGAAAAPAAAAAPLPEFRAVVRAISAAERAEHDAERLAAGLPGRALRAAPREPALRGLRRPRPARGAGGAPRAAGDVVAAFRALYRARFPIRRMRPDPGLRRRRLREHRGRQHLRLQLPRRPPARRTGPSTPTGGRSTSTRSRTRTSRAAAPPTGPASPTSTARRRGRGWPSRAASWCGRSTPSAGAGAAAGARSGLPALLRVAERLRHARPRRCASPRRRPARRGLRPHPGGDGDPGRAPGRRRCARPRPPPPRRPRARRAGATSAASTSSRSTRPARATSTRRSLVERRGDGFRVRYAIADVAAFVAPGGAVDAAARERGVTVYMPDRRSPLHPDALGEGAASLLPGRRPAGAALDDRPRRAGAASGRSRSSGRWCAAGAALALRRGAGGDRRRAATRPSPRCARSGCCGWRARPSAAG